MNLFTEAILIVLFSCQIVAQNGPLFLVATKTDTQQGDDSLYEATTYTQVESSEYNHQCECQVHMSENTLSYQGLDYNSRVELCNSSDTTFLDFCSSLLFQTENGDNYTYNIRVQTAVEDITNTMGIYNNREELCEVAENIRDALQKFESILERTLVCVYLKACENKTTCLNAYIRWLCTTQLKLYTPQNDTSLYCPSNDTVNGTDGITYVRVKPCFGVCTDVLRMCPYYLLSSYQSDDKSGYIYGGYPAFACPSQQTIGRYFTYGNEECDCIGNGYISYYHNLLTLLIVLVTLSSLLI